MSFLLLKSTRRGQQPLQGQHRSGSTIGRNHNISVAASSSSSRSNDSSSFSSNSKEPIPQYNRFLSNRGSTAPSTNQVADGGCQVQVQRPRTHFQKRRSYVQQQTPQQNEVLHDSKQQHEVCMDEVMEDLRILERQQRDSQRLLQSVKLTKQHKLSQKEQLEQTLASLKYKNGQCKAQLLLARQVLSSSTRSLASTKLRSDKSSDNLKRFDEKLKRSIETIRSLHEKRRRIDDLLLRLAEKDAIVRKELEEHRNALSKKMTELEDSKHKEELLVKAIQNAKLKVQELMEDTGKVRSHLGELELELTETQQMEVSTRMRVESIQKDIEKENTRHELMKKHHDGRMTDLTSLKEKLLNQVADIKERITGKEHQHLSLFEKCVEIQKSLGHEVSDSAMNARLNVAQIRIVAEETKSKLLEETTRISNLELQIEAMEANITSQCSLNGEIRLQNQVLAKENGESRQTQEKRVAERQDFITKVDDAKHKLQELRDIESSVEKESNSVKEELDTKTAEINGIQNARKERLVQLTIETEDLDQKYNLLVTEMQKEKLEREEMVNVAKSKSDDAKRELEQVQKQADEFSKLPPLEDDVSIEAMKKEEDENVSKLLLRQAEMMKEYPCLSKIEISFDTSKPKKFRIDSALSELRAECEARIEACRAERHRRIAAKQEEAKARTRTEKRNRKALEKTQDTESRSTSRTESTPSFGSLSSRSTNDKSHGEDRRDRITTASKLRPKIESEIERTRDKTKTQRSYSSSQIRLDRKERESSSKRKHKSNSSGKNETKFEIEELVCTDTIDSNSRLKSSNIRGGKILPDEIPSGFRISKGRDDKTVDKNRKSKKALSKFDKNSDVGPYSVKYSKLSSNVSKTNSDVEDESLVSEKKFRGVLRTTANDDEWTHDGTISTTRSKVRFEDESYVSSKKDMSTYEVSKRPSTITISGMKKPKMDMYTSDFEDEEFVITKKHGITEREKPSKRKEKTNSSKISSKSNSETKYNTSSSANRHTKETSHAVRSKSAHRESSDSFSSKDNQSSREKKVISSGSKKRTHSSSAKDRSTSSIVREKLNALKNKSSALSQSSSRSRRKKSKVSGTGLSFNEDEEYSFLNA